MKKTSHIIKVSSDNNKFFFTLEKKLNDKNYKCLIIENKKPWHYHWKTLKESEFLNLNDLHWNVINKEYLSSIKIPEILDKVLGKDFKIINRTF